MLLLVAGDLETPPQSSAEAFMFLWSELQDSETGHKVA